MELNFKVAVSYVMKVKATTTKNPYIILLFLLLQPRAHGGQIMLNLYYLLLSFLQPACRNNGHQLQKVKPFLIIYLYSYRRRGYCTWGRLLLQNQRFFKYIGQSILLFCLFVCLSVYRLHVKILNRSSQNFTTW